MHVLIKVALLGIVMCLVLLGLLRIAREFIRPPMFLVPPDSQDEE